MKRREGNLAAIDLFQVLFVGLKLTDEIDWSWWLVWAPYLSVFAILFISGLLKRDR